MKTVTYNTYTFDELSEQAQQKALESLYDCNVDFDGWDDCVLESWQNEKLLERGFQNAKILYSGFFSQGDGASFTASVDILKFLKFHKVSKEYHSLIYFLNRTNDGCDASISIMRSGRYYHANTMYSDSDAWNISDKAYNQLKELEKIVLSCAKGYAEEIYRELEKEYDFLTSKEQVKDTIINNEWHFTIDGKMDNKGE